MGNTLHAEAHYTLGEISLKGAIDHDDPSHIDTKKGFRHLVEVRLDADGGCLCGVL